MAKEVKIIVRGKRRAEPDLMRLARALLQQGLAEQQADAKVTNDDQPSDQPGEAVS